MSAIEIGSFWATCALYAVGTVFAFTAVASGRDVWALRALVLASAGLVTQSVTIIGRWISVRHFPYIGTYENVLVGSWAIVALFIVLAWRWRGLGMGGVLVLPVCLLTLGYGLTQAAARSAVTPAYQSGWLIVHVTFAWITYSAYTSVAALAIAQLWRDRAQRTGREVPAWLPTSSRIDDLSMRLVAFGFLNNGVMIASGSIWAYRLWGAFWRWDPVETWSLLTWLAYGLYMHARLTLGWRGRRLAWVALAALFGVMMAFWGVQLLPNASFHIFQNIGDINSGGRMGQ